MSTAIARDDRQRQAAQGGRIKATSIALTRGDGDEGGRAIYTTNTIESLNERPLV